MLAHKLLKRATKTADSRGNESRIAKQDSKIFPRIVETANGKPANGEDYLYSKQYKLTTILILYYILHFIVVKLISNIMFCLQNRLEVIHGEVNSYRE